MTSFRNSIISIVATSFLLVQQQQWNVVDAFPTGSGSCVGGQPAVGAPHTSAASITNGTLKDFNMTFAMNKFVLTPNTAALPFFTQFQSGLPFEVAINASTGNMKGCFIRFQTEDEQSKDVFDLTAKDNTQLASICDTFDTATGLTHTNADDKVICGGTVTANVNGRILVDVTVVINLEGTTQSTYAYNQYVLESIVSFPPRTSAPTVTKAPAMVSAPVMAPTVSSMAPVPIIGNFTLNPTTAPPVPIIGNFTLNPTAVTAAGSDAPSSQPSAILIGGMSDAPSSSPTESLMGSPSAAPFIVGILPSAQPSTMNGMDNMPTALPLFSDNTAVPSVAPVAAPISNAVTFRTRFISTVATTVMGIVFAALMM